MQKSRPRTLSGEKNLIGERLLELRKKHHLSQSDVSHRLQLAGYDVEKNVISRIENNKRYVTDIEVNALAQVFDISCDDLIHKK